VKVKPNQTPRGIRNHNPGNLRWGDPWQGLVPEHKRDDKDFCQFESAAFGIRALARTLITYQDKHGLRTIRGIITRWAPPADNNNTAAYIASVARQTGHEPDEELNLHHYEDILTMVQAIIRVENGREPLTTPNTWYDEATLNKGLALAGVVPQTPTAGNIPVTKETIGATGSVGVAQIADVLTSVPVDTLAQAGEHLNSGSGLRLGIGIALIAVAVFIAWSQVKRYRDGTL